VTADALSEVIRARGGKPLAFIDLAVPRDIDPECAELPGVSVYDMDDLQAVVARNLEVRAEEALRAEQVVEDEIQRFAKWLGQLDVVPTIAALRRHGDEIVDGVLADNANRWESLSDKDRERVEALARAVAQRLLHEPTLRMRADGSHGRLQVIRELFGLDEGVAPAGDAPADVVELDERRARDQ
jgi:glutamyl-tRNA reductase